MVGVHPIFYTLFTSGCWLLFLIEISFTVEQVIVDTGQAM